MRNAIRPELYHGVLKGPVQTLLESSGNDADTAGLLIALLRAKGIPARYVRGTADLPAPLAVAVTGTASADRALRAFQRAGVPSEAVNGPGGIAAIRVERVWAEAYVPYANYRGALLDGFEKAWVPLDPGLKRLAPPDGYVLRSAGFDPVVAFDDYLVAAPGLTPLEFFRERAKAALAERRPDVSYEEALARRDVIEQNLGLLPSTLPYAVVARAEVGYAPPEPLVHTARVLVESNGATLLDASFAVPALLGQRLTLSYVPFEADDEEVVRQYGGLFRTPPYLVEVKPVLKLGGVVLASGTAGTGLGVKLDFRIELGMPGGQGVVANRVVAGNLTAIGLAAGAGHHRGEPAGRGGEPARASRVPLPRPLEPVGRGARGAPARRSHPSLRLHLPRAVGGRGRVRGRRPALPRALRLEGPRRRRRPAALGPGGDRGRRGRARLPPGLGPRGLRPRAPALRGRSRRRERLDREGAAARGPAGDRGARPRPRERGRGAARPSPRRGREGRDP